MAARSRVIKPGIITNEELCSLGEHAYILFTSLWMLADREGRLEDRPKRIKVEGMPFWNCDVDALLTKLAECNFIERYQIDGHRYVQILNFTKHQHLHPRESASVIPPPSSLNGNHSGHAKDMPRTDLGTAKDMPRRVKGKAKVNHESENTTHAANGSAQARKSASETDPNESDSPPISLTDSVEYEEDMPRTCLGNAKDMPRRVTSTSTSTSTSDAAAAFCIGKAFLRAREDHCEIYLDHDSAAASKTSSSSSSSNSASLAKELSRTHPRLGSVHRAIAAIDAEHLTPEQCDEMRRSHERYVAYYSREHPEFVPSLDRWIEDGDWLRLPPGDEASPPKKKPVSRMMQLAIELEEQQKQRGASHVRSASTAS